MISDEEDEQNQVQIIELQSNQHKSVEEISLIQKDGQNQAKIVKKQYQQKSVQEIILNQKIEQKNYKKQQSLPGQVLSEDESFDDELKNKKVHFEEFSSSNEFDIDIFRQQSQIPINEQIIQTIIPNNCSNQTYIKILGIKFQLDKLQERNKDPIFYLKFWIGSMVTVQILITINFVVGLKFQIIPTILSFLINTLLVMFMATLAQTSVKDGLEVNPKIAFFIFTITSMFTGLFVYSFVINFPFDSIPIFLMVSYVTLIFRELIGALAVTPNFTPWEDPNYQLKFIAERILEGFFNGTGMIDTLSDLVLGVQLVQQTEQKILLSIGIILFILCFIDHMNVLRKVFVPEKITIKQYLLVIIIEILIMSMTVYVLYGVSHGDLEKDGGGQNEDTLIAVIISLMTTLINFLHHIFRVYNMIISERNEREHKSIFSIVFRSDLF